MCRPQVSVWLLLKQVAGLLLCTAGDTSVESGTAGLPLAHMQHVLGHRAPPDHQTTSVLSTNSLIRLVQHATALIQPTVLTSMHTIPARARTLVKEQELLGCFPELRLSG